MNKAKKENVRVFTKKEVATLLKVSVRTVDRKVAEREMPAPRNIGGIKRWDAQEFWSWWDESGEEGRNTYQPKPA